MAVNRIGLPNDFRTKKLKKGEMISYEDGQLTGVCWMDKRPVAALSTTHDAPMTNITRRSRSAARGVETILKPTMIAEYNSYVHGRCGNFRPAGNIYYGFCHCSKKWWKRAFFHLLEASMVNAYVLYSSKNTTRRLSHMNFIPTVNYYVYKSGKHDLNNVTSHEYACCY